MCFFYNRHKLQKNLEKSLILSQPVIIFVINHKIVVELRSELFI